MSALGGFDDDDAVDLDAEESEETPPAPALVYGSVNEFYSEYLRSVYVRRINGKHRVWKADWWTVDEAIVRLEALWRSWEFLRQDPSTGMSVWMRDHADHHMAVLMDPDGPFAGSEETTKAGDPLPHSEPPEGLFPDVREQE